MEIKNVIKAIKRTNVCKTGEIGGSLMIYKTHYDSSLGGMLLSADEKGLTGLWFDGQKYYAQGQADLEPEAGAAICNAPCEEEHAPLLAEVKALAGHILCGKRARLRLAAQSGRN